MSEVSFIYALFQISEYLAYKMQTKMLFSLHTKYQIMCFYIYSAKIKSTHFYSFLHLYYRVNTNLANERWTHNRWFMC